MNVKIPNARPEPLASRASATLPAPATFLALYEEPFPITLRLSNGRYVAGYVTSVDLDGGRSATVGLSSDGGRYTEPRHYRLWDVAVIYPGVLGLAETR